MGWRTSSIFTVGLGILISLVMLGELLSFLLLPSQPDALWVFNYVASIPFIMILVASGWLLRKYHIPVSLDSRLIKWVVGGTALLGIFFVLIAVLSEDNLLVQVSIARWGVSAGAGIGALIGFFESKAIRRAVEAERAQLHNEELQRQNDRLQKFENVVAHDLRNPLTVASAHVDMLKGECREESIHKIETSHERMSEIIDAFLKYARTGQLVDETEFVSLSSLVDSSWGSISGQDAGVVLESDGEIKVDPDRVMHLFENLFRNGIEHAGPDVTLRVGMLDDGFYIEDDGEGIPKDQRSSVFDSGFSTNKNGTGFGLAIVKQIAEAHRWETDLTESHDGGARFEFTNVDVRVKTESADPVSITR